MSEKTKFQLQQSDYAIVSLFNLNLFSVAIPRPRNKTKGGKPMKRFIKTTGAVLVIMILSTVTVFGAYSATEADIADALSVSPLLSTTICQSVREDNCGTYTDKTPENIHIPLGCTQNGKKASTTVYFSSKHGSQCYADTAVFNTAGVNAASTCKYGNSLSTTATASVNISNINVRDVLHAVDSYTYCHNGQHNYFAYK